MASQEKVEQSMSYYELDVIPHGPYSQLLMSKNGDQ